MSNVSQDRLNPEVLQAMQEKMVAQINQLAAERDRYKRALRKIICLNVPMPDEVFNLANDALEGADTQ